MYTYLIKTYFKSWSYLKVKVKWKEINFLSIVNGFVIYVLSEWYSFDWKAFLLNIKLWWLISYFFSAGYLQGQQWNSNLRKQGPPRRNPQGRGWPRIHRDIWTHLIRATPGEHGQLSLCKWWTVMWLGPTFDRERTEPHFPVTLPVFNLNGSLPHSWSSNLFRATALHQWILISLNLDQL